MLVADRDRDASRLATTTEQLTKFLASLRQGHQLPHIVDAGKLRLAGENRCLSEQNGVVVGLERAIEKLVAFFDEDVEQIRCVARRSDVAEPVAQRRADLSESESGQSVVEYAGDLGDRGVGDL